MNLVVYDRKLTCPTHEKKAAENQKTERQHVGQPWIGFCMAIGEVS